MFLKLKSPEGTVMLVRAARIVAIAGVEEGGSRVFLGGALSCLVQEGPDEVVALMERSAEAE